MTPGRWAAAGMIAGLTVLAAGLIWLLRPAGGPDRDQVVAAARREAQAGRFGEAHRLLATLPALATVDDEVADLLGTCDHASGRFEAALANWSQVGPDSPRWPAVVLARAQTLAGDLGRFADAEALLESALDRAGALRIDVAHTLLRLYYLEGRPAAMTRTIRRTRPDWRDPAAELRDLWMVDHARVELDEIRQTLRAAEAKAPGDDRVRLAVAALALREHRLDDAVGPLDECLRHQPDDPAVRLARLRLARDAADVAGVEAELARLPAAAMAEPDLLDLMAWMATQRGDDRAARLALVRRVAVRPANPVALAQLAALETRASHPDRASELLRQKAALDATQERYRRLIEDRPPDRAFAELAALAESLGRPFEALGWWSLAERTQPADPTVRAAIRRLQADQEPTGAAGPGTLADRVAEWTARSTPE